MKLDDFFLTNISLLRFILYHKLLTLCRIICYVCISFSFVFFIIRFLYECLIELNAIIATKFLLHFNYVIDAVFDLCFTEAQSS